MKSIPIVDLGLPCNEGGELDKELVQLLVNALHHTGFVGIQGHGIHEDLVSNVRQEVVSLFALPHEQKAEHQVSQENYRGYIPCGFFTPNSAKEDVDWYEGYKLHCEVAADDSIRHDCDLYGPNLWPTVRPKLQELVAEYWQRCDELSITLLRALFGALKLPLKTLDAAFKQPLSNMTLLHYPPSEPTADHFGIHPHKDTDVLTILAPDKVGGLFVSPRESNEWVEVQVPSNTLIVNVGDMLETWSGGYFVSTPHKVVNKSGKERYSFPYFAVPRHDVLIAPLIETPNKDRYLNATAGDISRQIWQSNWPDAEAVDSNLDPYIE